MIDKTDEAAQSLRLSGSADLSQGQPTICAALRRLLADAFAIYPKTKNFHWHMSGPRPIALARTGLRRGAAFARIRHATESTWLSPGIRKGNSGGVLAHLRLRTPSAAYFVR